MISTGVKAEGHGAVHATPAMVAVAATPEAVAAAAAVVQVGHARAEVP